MATLDISVKQGATYTLIMTVQDSVPASINLTGYTFRGQIRTSTSDITIQAPFSFVLGVQSGATLGTVTGTISAADTALIVLPANERYTRKITKMIYDIEMIEPGGNVVRILEGTVSVSPEVTK